MLIKKWQLTIALSFLAINLLIGLSSGVTWTVALTRGLGWSCLVLGILIMLGQFTIGILEQVNKQQLGASQFDITLPSEEFENLTTDSPELSGRQIENNLEEMVRNNPERVAELARKMGLE